MCELEECALRVVARECDRGDLTATVGKPHSQCTCHLEAYVRPPVVSASVDTNFAL